MTCLPLHSPAELLLLLHKRHTPSLRQLLRVTFLDLLRQQVLVISREPIQPHPHDPISWQEYVMAGSALTSYAALPHEKLLFDTFRYEAQLRIPFRHYVRMILTKASTASAYCELIEANERTKQAFSQHWFSRLLNMRRLTPAGEQLRAATEAELVRLDKEFVARAAHSSAQAYQFMQQVGGALFLLPSFTSEVGRRLERELQQVPESTYGGDFGGGDTSTSWNTHGDSFDGHCGGDGDSGSGSDSGCGGDSGCSGCGGCGGD